MMLLLKIIGIGALVIVALFLLTLVIYYFNLDMKLAAKLMPLMDKIYDAGKAKRDRKRKMHMKVEDNRGQNGTV